MTYPASAEGETIRSFKQSRILAKRTLGMRGILHGDLATLLAARARAQKANAPGRSASGR